jgi:hypothetical protein
VKPIRDFPIYFILYTIARVVYFKEYYILNRLNHDLSRITQDY